MENKILVINVSNSSKEETEELQHDLFKNGYEWCQSGKKIETFYKSADSVVIIDNLMYTMREDDVKFLSDEGHKILYIDSVVTYYRFLKLKKIRKNNGR